MRERREGARGGQVIEATGHGLFPEPVQLDRPARSADEFNPRAGAVARERLVGEELRHGVGGERGIERAQGELQLPLLGRRVGQPRAGLQRGKELRREVVDGKPHGVVEERIRADAIHGAQDQPGGARGGNLRQRAHGLDAHARVRVLHQPGKLVEAVVLRGRRGGLQGKRMVADECGDNAREVAEGVGFHFSDKFPDGGRRRAAGR